MSKDSKRRVKPQLKFTIIRADKRHRADIDRLIKLVRIADGLEGPVKNFWVAKVGERIVGCAGMDFINKRVGVFTHLAVEPEFRHHGIGAALIAKRFAAARERGVKTLTLITMYYQFNFYKRRGFRTIPRSELPSDIAVYPQFTAQRYMKCAVMIHDKVQTSK